MHVLLISIGVLSVAFLIIVNIDRSVANLRYASDPQGNFRVRNRENSIPFITNEMLYMEPSTFNYQGLENQRMNNYDFFLRSSIDSMQRNRNFQREAGKDMLPYRTLEATMIDASGRLTVNRSLIVNPGTEYVLPLRLNNPHVYEIELNIWVMNSTIVVPLRKPVCAGEGYQDSIISFIVPRDFNDALGEKVFGFRGCCGNDCVLQLYAHSVESKAYAVGTPLVVQGWHASKATATNNNQVQPMTVDPGIDLSKLPNEVCPSSIDPSTYVLNAVPRWARHVSDVYNHAYQSNDYSPYSGQQHESISKNMQAACVLRMISANRGQFGKSLLTTSQHDALNRFRTRMDDVVGKYQTMTNRIIDEIFKNGAKSTGTVAGQRLNNCFRCADTASVSANRAESATYMPSFIINDAALLDQTRQMIQQTDPSASQLVDANGVVRIYAQTLHDLASEYEELQTKFGFSYQTAMIKPSCKTMNETTTFTRIDSQLLLLASSASVSNTMNTNEFPGGSSARTIAAWIKRSESKYSQGPYESIISFNTVPASCNERELMMGIATASSRAMATVCNVGNVFGPANIKLNIGEWHHISLTISSSGVFTVYGDGVAGSSSTYSINTAKERILIGDRSFPDNKFVGLIDDLSFYGRALSESEISNIINGLTVRGLITSFDGARNAGIGGIVTDITGKYALPGISLAYGPDSAERSANRGLSINVPDYSVVAFSTKKNMPSGNDARTVAVWIKEIGQRAVSSSILSFANNQRVCGTSELSFYIDEFGRVGVTVCAVQAAVHSISTVKGEWNHVAFTYNPADRRFALYVNGVQSYQIPSLHSPLQTSLDEVLIGLRALNKFDPFLGYLDNLHIFKKTLTADEIVHDKEGRASIVGGLTILFDMGVRDGQLFDQINSNNATLINHAAAVSSRYGSA